MIANHDNKEPQLQQHQTLLAIYILCFTTNYCNAKRGLGSILVITHSFAVRPTRVSQNLRGAVAENILHQSGGACKVYSSLKRPYLALDAGCNSLYMSLCATSAQMYESDEAWLSLKFTCKH